MSGEPEPLMKWLVTKHNELRYRHGVQMLTWDWSLAWNSYNYVVGCPKGHSGQQGIGENLAWGHNDFNHAMRDWYDEVCAPVTPGSLGQCLHSQGSSNARCQLETTHPLSTAAAGGGEGVRATL